MTNKSETTIVFVALDQKGADLARRVTNALPGALLHGLGGRVEVADVFFDDVTGHLRDLFATGRTIVGVMAAGILIRALGPGLSDKKNEPPVLALGSDGAHVVPLLGGHRGANDLAEKIAVALDIDPAITTASDARFGFGPGLSLDAPPQGWRVENEAAAKGVMAALLAGERVPLCVEAGDARWLSDSAAPFDRVSDGGVLKNGPAVWVTDCLVEAAPGVLLLRPPTLALGVGCARSADEVEVIALASRALADAGLSAASVATVVSVDVKADEGAVHATADHFGVSARFFTPERLEVETPRLANPSEVVFGEVGCHGVCEGAALAAAGKSATLVCEKIKSETATVAAARCNDPITHASLETEGAKPQGRLAVVGIGPGAPTWRTAEAETLLHQATDVVGYGLYLDLVDDLIGGKVRHTSELAEEEARARLALDLAAQGKRVVLVASGDAGIFALATLVMELLDREDKSDWNRVAVSVAPGVSAFQAAAARIGAPVGHDFCVVSLSDLLTPWEVIARRLEGAGVGDFVVAFYNPVSKRRRRQIEEARDILLKHRGSETPVVLARNLGRAGESLDVITLGELNADSADMLTLVLVGSSQTRITTRGTKRWVYTPRGYSRKMDEQGYSRKMDKQGYSRKMENQKREAS